MKHKVSLLHIINRSHTTMQNIISNIEKKVKIN